MISFDKPQNLNGAELRKELRNANIQISDNFTAISLDGNETLWLDIDSKDKSKAATIVAAHNGTVTASELTIAEKLALVGLNLDELKAALGGN